MALETCSDCGVGVSDSAFRCPGCGSKSPHIRRKERGMYLAGGVFALVALAALIAVF